MDTQDVVKNADENTTIVGLESRVSQLPQNSQLGGGRRPFVFVIEF